MLLGQSCGVLLLADGIVAYRALHYLEVLLVESGFFVVFAGRAISWALGLLPGVKDLGHLLWDGGTTALVDLVIRLLGPASLIDSLIEIWRAEFLMSIVEGIDLLASFFAFERSSEIARVCILWRGVLALLVVYQAAAKVLGVVSTFRCIAPFRSLWQAISIF